MMTNVYATPTPAMGTAAGWLLEAPPSTVVIDDLDQAIADDEGTVVESDP